MKKVSRIIKKGQSAPVSMVLMAILVVSVIAIVGMLSSPPTLDWALTKVTGSGYVVFATGEYAAIQTDLDNLFANQSIIRNNQAKMQLDNVNVRGRAYPWNVSTTLTLTDGGAPNVFGATLQLIPKNTFKFGDTPNVILAKTIIEALSDDCTYIIELNISSDGVNFTPIGSARFNGGTSYVPIFINSRAFDNDTVYMVLLKLRVEVELWFK